MDIFGLVQNVFSHKHEEASINIYHTAAANFSVSLVKVGVHSLFRRYNVVYTSTNLRKMKCIHPHAVLLKVAYWLIRFFRLFNVKQRKENKNYRTLAIKET